MYEYALGVEQIGLVRKELNTEVLEELREISYLYREEQRKSTKARKYRCVERFSVKAKNPV